MACGQRRRRLLPRPRVLPALLFAGLLLSPRRGPRSTQRRPTDESQLVGHWTGFDDAWRDGVALAVGSVGRGADPATFARRLGAECEPLVNERMAARASSVPGWNRQDRRLARVWWLHVPKSGTSFGAQTVIPYACPAIPSRVFTPEGQRELAADGKADARKGVKMHLFENYFHLCPPDAFAKAKRWAQANTSAVKGHTALPKPLASSRRGLVMLRDPVQRACSAFQFKHAVGLDPALRPRLRSEVKTPKDFVRFPGIASCATKMLTHKNCAESVNVTEARVRAAQENLREAFAFVGITDYWNESVCLFHAQLGGHPLPSAFDNNRPSIMRWSSKEAREAAVARIRGCREVNDSDEPHDSKVYRTALGIFAERLCLYGLKVPKALWDTVLTDELREACPQP